MDKLRNKAVLNTTVDNAIEELKSSFFGEVNLKSLSFRVIESIKDVSKYSLEELVEKIISMYFYSCVYSDEMFEDFYLENMEDVKGWIKSEYINKL